MTEPQQVIYRTVLIPIFVALISGGALQVIAGLVWGGKVIARIEQMEQQDLKHERTDEKVEAKVQQFPLLEQRLKVLEDTVRSNSVRIDTMQQSIQAINPITQITQIQFDAFKANMIRLEDQQKRLNDAIDGIYRTLDSRRRTEQKSQ